MKCYETTETIAYGTWSIIVLCVMIWYIYKCVRIGR